MKNQGCGYINDCAGSTCLGEGENLKGSLIVISGPSGAGKGTVCRQLLADNAGLCYSVSATTRQKRSGEIDGVNYFFVSKDQFAQMREKDELLEWAQVYDNYYGTPRKHVTELLEQGRDVVLEIDIQGAMKIKEKFPEGVFIYIVPPSFEELKKRIENRNTDSLQEIQNRLASFHEELSYVNNYRYLIVNNKVSEVVEKILAIIAAEKCLVKRNLAIIEKISAKL